jgi:hypothetical protein
MDFRCTQKMMVHKSWFLGFSRVSNMNLRTYSIRKPKSVLLQVMSDGRMKILNARAMPGGIGKEKGSRCIGLSLMTVMTVPLHLQPMARH